MSTNIQWENEGSRLVPSKGQGINETETPGCSTTVLVREKGRNDSDRFAGLLGCEFLDAGFWFLNLFLGFCSTSALLAEKEEMHVWDRLGTVCWCFGIEWVRMFFEIVVVCYYGLGREIMEWS